MMRIIFSVRWCCNFWTKQAQLLQQQQFRQICVSWMAEKTIKNWCFWLVWIDFMCHYKNLPSPWLIRIIWGCSKQGEYVVFSAKTSSSVCLIRSKQNECTRKQLIPWQACSLKQLSFLCGTRDFRQTSAGVWGCRQLRWTHIIQLVVLSAIGCRRTNSEFCTSRFCKVWQLLFFGWLKLFDPLFSPTVID